MAPKPTDNKDRIIALLEGDSGCGKSFFLSNLKNAVIYDTDLGGGLSDYEDRIKRNGSERIEVTSYNEILLDIQTRLRNGRLKENIGIDHITGLHQDAILRHNPTQESDYGRSNNKSTYEWRQIREFARTFDCNLFCVSHMKAEYENDKQVGKMADGAKNIEADMQIVLRLESSKNIKGRKKYPAIAHVIKWRRDPEDARGMPPDSFLFTLEEFEKIHGRNYLREREQIQLVRAETLGTLNKMLAELDKEKAAGYVKEWLKAGGVAGLEYLREDQALKCIAFIDNKLKGVQA